MRKILIIGKTGQLGTELIKILDNVIAPNIEELDISLIQQTGKYILSLNPSIIINTAAYHDLSECEEDPYAAFFMNWLAVRNLALTAKKINALFVHFSTNYVFDGLKTVPYKEDDEVNPIQIYGMSKLAGEESVLRYYPENSFIIRTSVLFGGNGSPLKGNFILNRIKESKNERLAIDSEQFFSITYAKNLALAIKRLIEGSGEKIKPGVYHIVNKGICSWFELTKYVFNLINSECSLEPVTRYGVDGKIKRPIHTPLYTERIESLGIEMPHWKEAVEKYLIEVHLK